MSAHPQDLSQVTSVTDYLRDLMARMETIDGLLHPAIEEVRMRLVALEFAERPILQERRREAEERLASGKGFDILPDSVLQAHL